MEYFVSYYDYYQPEAYVPSSDTYIAKDSSINDEIDKLRLSATASLVRAEGCDYCGKCFLYLWSGQPGGLQGAGAVSLRPGHGKATGTRCCAKLIDIQYDRNEMDFHARHFPGARGCAGDFSGDMRMIMRTG